MGFVHLTVRFFIRFKILLSLNYKDHIILGYHHRTLSAGVMAIYQLTLLNFVAANSPSFFSRVSSTFPDSVVLTSYLIGLTIRPFCQSNDICKSSQFFWPTHALSPPHPAVFSRFSSSFKTLSQSDVDNILLEIRFDPSYTVTILCELGQMLWLQLLRVPTNFRIL